VLRFSLNGEPRSSYKEMPDWVASASARSRGSQASIASPVTVDIRAGIPDPITGPAVGAIEVTSMVSSVVTRAES
jgi:hypothetical protein